MEGGGCHGSGDRRFTGSRHGGGAAAEGNHARAHRRLSLHGHLDQGGSEIAAYDPATKRLFTVNLRDQRVDVIDIGDPTKPYLTLTLPPSTSGAPRPTASPCATASIAVAVEAFAKTVPGRWCSSRPRARLEPVAVGALPDMLTFTPDGRLLLVANEGEPNSTAYDGRPRRLRQHHRYARRRRRADARPTSPTAGSPRSTARRSTRRSASSARRDAWRRTSSPSTSPSRTTRRRPGSRCRRTTPSRPRSSSGRSSALVGLGLQGSPAGQRAGRQRPGRPAAINISTVAGARACTMPDAHRPFQAAGRRSWSPPTRATRATRPGFGARRADVSRGLTLDPPAFPMPRR